MKEQLAKLGLTNNESDIFVYLLSHPNSTTGPMIKQTRIANSRVYASLQSLKEKGLVTYTVQKDGAHYSAADPQALLEKEEERRLQIDALIPQLKLLKAEPEQQTHTAVYEGFDGFRTAFKKIVDDTPRNGTIKIIGFAQQEYAFGSLRTFLKNISLKSAQKNHTLQMLLDQDNPQAADRRKEKHTVLKILPKGYVSPCAMDITDDAVYMFLWDKEPYCFMIKNKKIADSFKSYFDVLWTIAK